MNYKTFKFFFIFILSFQSQVFGQEFLCSEVLQYRELTMISFYDDVLRRGGLTLEDLKLTKAALENGRTLPNPFLSKLNSIEGTVQLLRSRTFTSLVSSGANSPALLNWLRSSISELENEVVKKREASDETIRIYRSPVYHRIEPGSFLYESWGGNIDRKASVLKPILMQSTHVTQAQWLELMSENPSFHRSEHEAEEMESPVENLTIWSAMVYANRLSIKEGLEPVYDLDNLSFTGKPERGNLSVESEELEVKISDPDGDLYNTEGYRLPTLDEYLMVMTDRGRFGRDNFAQFFDDAGKAITDFFNFSKSMRNAPNEVYSLKPFYSNGNNFYDLRGNVFSFTNNLDSNKGSFLFNQTSVNRADDDAYLILAGGSHSSSKGHILEVLYYELDGVNARSGYTGFRLVRSLRDLE